jgi:hypothetical protein
MPWKWGSGPETNIRPANVGLATVPSYPDILVPAHAASLADNPVEHRRLRTAPKSPRANQAASIDRAGPRMPARWKIRIFACSNTIA